LANRETITLRGKIVLPWDDIASISLVFYLGILPCSDDFLRLFLLAKSNSKAGPDLDALALNIYSVWMSRRLKKRSKHVSTSDKSLLPWLDYSEELSCRDAQDRVFALLSISKDAEDLRIEPNYSKSVEDVATETTIRLLQTSVSNKVTEVLVYACQTHHTRNFGIPSWAINIVHPTQMMPVQYRTEVWAPRPQDELPEPPRFEADLEHYPIMVLKGKILAYISLSSSCRPSYPNLAIHKPSEYSKDYREKMGAFMTSFTRIILEVGVTVDTASAFFRVIATDKSWQMSSLNDTAFYFYSWYRWDCLAVYESISNTPLLYVDLATQLLGLIGNKFAGNLTLLDQLTTEEMRVLDACYHYFTDHGRSFGITKDKRMFNAMNQAEEGDAKASFQGADKLFILRPEGSKYRLIGEVFVDGLMSGEAYEGVDHTKVDYDIRLI
jgi:hypothetical protein